MVCMLILYTGTLIGIICVSRFWMELHLRECNAERIGGFSICLQKE